MRKLPLSTAALLILSLTQVPAASAGSAPPPSAQRTYTLPTGDHVLMTRAGPQFVPAPGHGKIAFTTLLNGQYTVVPATELKHLSSLDAFRIGAAEPRPAHPDSQMSLLRVKALTHIGKKAPEAEVVVINTDNLAAASYDGIMVDGEARLQVPNGHYSVAVAIYQTEDHNNQIDTELLTQTDVTVSNGGATVSLDGRRAHQVSFQTPLPSENNATTVAWSRGTKAKLSSLYMGAMAGTNFYVGEAAKPKTGALRFSVAARQMSPESAATPYSYVLAVPGIDHIPADLNYKIDAASLSTVDSTVVTDLPKQYVKLDDFWDVQNPGPANPPVSGLPPVEVLAPSSQRLYLSTVPGLSYAGLMTPIHSGNFLDGQLERLLTPKAGEHRTLTWRGGLTVPAPSTYDASCFVCREGDTLHGVGIMDTDFDGDSGQWSDGTTTITEDGKQIYQGGTLGQAFEQSLAAGKHRYLYTTDNTHSAEPSNLATSSRISWGFDSATTTNPTAVPILYASARFNTNAHSSIAPGQATLSLTARHQTGAADSPLKNATISISYDDGKTWLPTTTSIVDAAHATGTWTVPPDAKPGYLAVRIQAEDAQGSTVDETVEHAALVNAPDGLDPAGQGSSAKPACGDAPAGYAQCFALKSQRTRGTGLTRENPDGLNRSDLLSAYKLPETGGAGRTVAIVSAFDDPTAEADLAAYRSTFHLRPCTTQNGCFKKVNGAGKPAPLPKPDQGWSSETSLDLDMVSAICPDCDILLAEADDNSAEALAAAERTATGSGAVAVSNSWGGDENGSQRQWTSAFSHPGVAVTASSGNRGFEQAHWPASLPGVIAVGGTSLTRDARDARGWTETAWSRGSSGCSAYSAKPAWQKDTHCRMRTTADIAAVADPATGVAVFDQGEWAVFGGTSAAAPIIAAAIALAGNSASMTNASRIYSHPSALFDVTKGSNAKWDCGGDYLCNARKGYDAPTGMGTPRGLGAL
ncbi:S8 family serine peptidase [Amycolatopsis sp. NPDC059657]|uniref:S53 family peptidase n=1 Tax=Amycolatopsis sp. NPDC059657 TaxID=3346899 RepID=UPI0036717282